MREFEGMCRELKSLVVKMATRTEVYRYRYMLLPIDTHLVGVRVLTSKEKWKASEVNIATRQHIK